MLRKKEYRCCVFSISVLFCFFEYRYNSTNNKSTKLNDNILNLAKKALSGVEDEFDLEEIEDLSPQENTANELGMISLKVRKAAQELQVDDTPKGQMFGCAQQLGKLLENLVKKIVFICFIDFLTYLYILAMTFCEN